VSDTDGDDVDDGDEVNVHGTSPTNADSDADGMPDGWEITYGLTPDNPSDASGDTDGDGVSNLDEYFAGTNPTVNEGTLSGGVEGLSCAAQRSGGSATFLALLAMTACAALRRRTRALA
jgi:hypothetical protein